MSILSQVGGGDRWVEEEMRRWGMDLIYGMHKRKETGKWEYWGDVNITDDTIKELPLFLKNINDIYGNFIIRSTSLQSLKNSPQRIHGNFSCTGCCNLKTLNGGPTWVEHSYYCNNCVELESLEGCPRKIGWDFRCMGCRKLKTLKGGPEEVCNSFNISFCTGMKTLKGGPEYVGGEYVVRGCKGVETMEGFETCVCGEFLCGESGLQNGLRMNKDIQNILIENRDKYYVKTSIGGKR